MIYQYVFALALAALVPAIWMKVCKDQGEKYAAKCISISLGIAVAVLGAVASVEFANSSRVPLTDYAQSVRSQLPHVNGTFTCEGSELRFKGFHQVAFTRNAQIYSVNYPLDSVISDVNTLCYLGIKPNVKAAVETFQTIADVRRKQIENMLETRVLPENIKDPAEQKFLEVLLSSNTFVADRTKIATFVDVNVNTSKVNVVSPLFAESPKVKVPTSQLSLKGTSEPPLDQNLLNYYISSQ